MPKVIDLTGQIKGDFTILRKCKNRDKHRNVLWEYKCKCKQIHKTTTATWNNIKGICNHRINLIGKIFGYLLVTGKSKYTDKWRSSLWECKCLNCGKEKYIVSHSALIRKYKIHKSCGCIQYKGYVKISRIGKRKGKLVIKNIIREPPHNNNKKGRTLFYCDCDCGIKNFKIFSFEFFKENKYREKSCGCLLTEISKLPINERVKKGKKNKQQAKIGNLLNVNWEESKRIIEDAEQRREYV